MSQSETPANLTRTVVRGIGTAGAGTVLAEVGRLAAYLVLARLAVPSDFGEYAAAATVVAVGFLFTDSGMMAALVHRRDRLPEAANTALLATFAGGLVLSLIALASAPLIGMLFQNDRVGEVAAVLSGMLLMRSMGIVPTALLQRRFSFLRRTLVEPVGVAVFAVVAIVAMSAGHGVWALVMGHYALGVVQLVLLWALAGWRPRPGLASVGMWRELIGYGRHVIVAGVVERLGEQTDTVLVGRFLGTGALGQYSYGFRLVSSVYVTIVTASNWVLFPAFARIAEDKPRFRDAYLRAFRWMATVTIPISFLLLPLGPPLTVLALGDVWRDAGWVVMAMFALPMAQGLIAVSLEAVKADGRTERLTETHAVVAVLTALLMAAALPLFGMVGVAAALSGGMTIGIAYPIRVLKRTVPVSIRQTLWQAWSPLVAALAMAAVLLPVELLFIDAAGHGLVAGLAMVAVLAAAGIAIYLAVLRALQPAALGEIGDLLRLGRGGDPATQAAPLLPESPADPLEPAPDRDWTER